MPNEQLSANELAETLRENGVDEAEVTAILAVEMENQKHIPSSDAPEIQPGNALIVKLFFAVARYWEYAGMDCQRVYLNPVYVEARAKKFSWYHALEPQLIEKLWWGLDVMEQVALKTWREAQQGR